MAWNPEQYLKFADHRLRPALDLLARIDVERPSHIYDIGCGPGNVTVWLKRRWPEAEIVGVDNSSEMLTDAAKNFPGIKWHFGDVTGWQPPEPASVIYSNAALQWVDDHEHLLPKLHNALAKGGALAIQMPHNIRQASHMLLRLAAEEGPWHATLVPMLRDKSVADPEVYWRILRASGAIVDIWETDYLQRLEGEDAVLEWVLGTTLRPLLAALPSDQRGDFLADYRQRLRTAYPPEADGSCLFPFRRLFIVASKR